MFEVMIVFPYNFTGKWFLTSVFHKSFKGFIYVSLIFQYILKFFLHVAYLTFRFICFCRLHAYSFH